MPVGVTITFNKQFSCTYAYAPLALQICHRQQLLNLQYCSINLSSLGNALSTYHQQLYTGIPARGKSLPDLADLRLDCRKEIHVYLCLSLDCHCLCQCNSAIFSNKIFKMHHMFKQIKYVIKQTKL